MSGTCMDSRSFNKNAARLENRFKKNRVDDDSQCCLSCFNATTYEDSCLNFLFFLIVANELATKVAREYPCAFTAKPPINRHSMPAGDRTSAIMRKILLRLVSEAVVISEVSLNGHFTDQGGHLGAGIAT